jgi:hypothetical protein
MDSRSVLTNTALCQRLFFPSNAQQHFNDERGRFLRVPVASLASEEHDTNVELLMYYKSNHTIPRRGTGCKYTGRTLVHFHGNGESIAYPAMMLSLTADQAGPELLYMLQSQGLNIVCHVVATTKTTATRFVGEQCLIRRAGTHAWLAYRTTLSRSVLLLGIVQLLCEYRGYSGANGVPTALALIEDIPIIYDTIVNQLNIPVESLIVMGRSMGSIPAVHFASLYPQIAYGGACIETHTS